MKLTEIVDSSDIYTENAIIEKAFLGFDHQGLLSVVLMLQRSTGLHLFGDDVITWSAFGTEYLVRLLDTFQVNEWGELKGLPCRILRLKGHMYNADSDAIGHIVEDRWFYPQGMIDEYDAAIKKESENESR